MATIGPIKRTTIVPKPEPRVMPVIPWPVKEPAKQPVGVPVK